MVEDTQVKKITKRRIVKQTPLKTTEEVVLPAAQSLQPITGLFGDLAGRVTQFQADFERLQRQIAEVKQSWTREQKDHEVETAERNRQEELQRQRNQEAYLYEMSRKQKREEDEFADKKAVWEKELRDEKEAIAKDRLELERLRKLVDSFEDEKEKAAREATAVLQRELTEKFSTEKKLREQEIKSEKEILNLKINTLTQENARQASEITALKAKLDQATRQLEEVALKVIESGSNVAKTSAPSEV